MPTVPRSQCDHYQCKAHSIKGSRFCTQHTSTKTVSIDRQAFNAPYKTAAWAHIRQRQLSAQPLCAACLIDGRVTQADHVDHLFAWQTIGHQAFTRNIFQSLCAECHGIKSGLEKKGIFRHYTATATDYTAQDYSFILSQG